MEEIIKEAVEVLRRGGLILYPTDTVWGIGCDATNPEAVARIYELKRSINKKGMIILLDRVEKVGRKSGKIPQGIYVITRLGAAGALLGHRP